MKICIIAQVEPSISYGGGKAQYFLAKEWEQAGHEVEALGFRSLKAKIAKSRKLDTELNLTDTFMYFLKHHGHEYDVIDYDFRTFPELKAELPNTLLVARSVLFKRSAQSLNHPESPRLKHRLKRGYDKLRAALLRTPPDNRFAESLPHADLLNLTSKLDVITATEMGIPSENICQFPYALSDSTIAQMADIESPSDTKTPNLVFLGSFDFRKGCIDLAKAFHIIRQTYPAATLTLLGAKGLHVKESEVRYFFSKEDNPQVRVHMRFDPAKLTDLLSNHHLALFPSYNEGFPFAVQETLAAGIPTIAFRAPGAADILPEEWLVTCGDFEDLANRSISLIQKYDSSLPGIARDCIKPFQWNQIASATLDLYREKLEQKQQAAR